MLNLYTQTKEYYNDICDEIRLFTTFDKIILCESTDLKGDFILHFFKKNENNSYVSTIKYYLRNVCVKEYVALEELNITNDELENKRIIKRFIKNSFYNTLKEYYKKKLQWGSLTGIRPTKLARDISAKIGIDNAKEFFKTEYDVDDKKISLTFDILKNQQGYIEDIKSNSIDVYVGIPFCVSRCKYCSFISRDVSEHLKDEYLKKLFFEIQSFDYSNYDVRSVYIGGGTPTSLSAKELAMLLEIVTKHFPHKIEFSVEAGRADTITKEKLKLLKEFNVDRISINSQTTNDNTLELIGRKHTAKEFFQAFEWAKTFDFKCINTDVILGLPNENLDDVKKTLRDVSFFEPQNITVHTLALKKASQFAMDMEKNFVSQETINEMIDYSFEFMKEKYLPYYLYRQKYMAGNLENVGYALPGKQCIYNIDIMEELTSNCAFGAGAISKVVKNDKIERQANAKDVKTYIENTNNIIQKKKVLFNF